MNIYTVIGLFILCACHTGFAKENLNHRFAPHAVNEKGPIYLKMATAPTRSKNILFTLDDGTKGQLKLFQTKVKGKSIIKGYFVVNSQRAMPHLIDYQLVLHDSKGPIAQSKGSLKIERAQGQMLKFGSIVLAEDLINTIQSYSIKMKKEK